MESRQPASLDSRFDDNLGKLTELHPDEFRSSPEDGKKIFQPLVLSDAIQPRDTSPTGKAGKQSPEPLAAAARGGTVLPSRLEQLFGTLIFTVVAIFLSILWFIYIYKALLAQHPSLGVLLFSPGRTVAVVNILSTKLGLLISVVFGSLFDALRWQLAARRSGVQTTILLALGSSTSVLGLLSLLRAKGKHVFWCVQRLLSVALCVLITFILTSDITFTYVYDTVQSIPVIGGLALLNITYLSQIPVAYLALYFSTNTRSILGDSVFVTGISPIHCGGSNCSSYFLPGGIQIARLQDGKSNSTLLGGNVLVDAPVIIINQAPGIQLEFAAISEDYPFDLTSECTTYGNQSGDGLHLCVSSNNLDVIAGWSICPSILYATNQCFGDKSWTSKLDQVASMSVFKRYATTAYYRQNLSILSIDSIGPPEQHAVNPQDLRDIFQAVFNSSSTFQKDIMMRDALVYQLGWILRLYKDLFDDDKNSALNILNGFLTIPMQFSTTAWQYANISSLPSDLNTTASAAQVSYRVIAQPWTVYLFGASLAVLCLWSALMLVWILVQKDVPPNTSQFVEVDFGAIAGQSSVDSNTPSNDTNQYGQHIKEFSSSLREAGLENAESAVIVKALASQSIRVAEMPSCRGGEEIVLVTARENMQDLQHLGNLRRGKSYPSEPETSKCR